MIINGKGYNAKEIRGFLDETRENILKILLKSPKTLSEIAKELEISEQLAYYHLKYLINTGFVEKQGNKYVSYKAYYYLLSETPDFHVMDKDKIRESNIFGDFIENGIFDGIITVGSPDPHGPFSARARDGHYVGFLTAYLSKFVKGYKFSNYIRLDTDIISEKLLENNLIVIGGPVTNTISYRMNTVMKVRFLQEYNWNLYSEFTERMYSEDFHGLFAKIKNPWNRNKWIVVLSGKRAIGTKIVVLSLAKLERYIKKGKEIYVVVGGKDVDGDGKPEEVEILETSSP